MGCDQSKMNKPPLSPARVERIITIEPQKVIDPSGRELSRKEASAKSYQVVQSGIINMDPTEFEELLQEYKECEEHIHRLEKEDPLTLYYIKKSHLDSINEAAVSTESKIETCRKAIQNGETETVSNGKNLKKLIVEYSNKDIVSKAEQEFVTSANRLEIAVTELEMLQQEKALVESEVSEFKAICTKLIGYYNRQDMIAKKLTLSVQNQEETKLHQKLAAAETKKIKISETYQRWKEGRAQIIDSCRQFSSALKKWRVIKDDAPANLYDLTEEVRDDLVTALQCITNARLYIKSDLPYCSKSEMSVLEKAMSYIFIDMNTSERRLHADSCYTAFQNRAVALFAWIDMTIKEVIQPDVKKAVEDVVNAAQQLREVRFHTIRKQFPDVTWKTYEETPDDDPDLTTTNLSDSDSKNILEQLDASQLAKPPSKGEIYGKSSAATDYRSMFKDSLDDDSNSNLITTQIDQNLDEMIKQRKESLKNDLVNQDTLLVLPR